MHPKILGHKTSEERRKHERSWRAEIGLVSTLSYLPIFLRVSWCIQLNDCIWIGILSTTENYSKDNLYTLLQNSFFCPNSQKFFFNFYIFQTKVGILTPCATICYQQNCYLATPHTSIFMGKMTVKTFFPKNDWHFSDLPLQPQIRSALISSLVLH